VSVDRVDSDSDGGRQDHPRDDRQAAGDQRQPVVTDRQASELHTGCHQAATTTHVEPVRPAARPTTDTIHVPGPPAQHSRVN